MNMVAHLPLWALYAQTFGPIFVAIVAAWIAYRIQNRQWQTAQNRLVFDLYKDRMKIYADLKRSLFEFITGHAGEIEGCINITKATLLAEVFFENDVIDYISEIDQKVKMVIHLKQKLQNASTLSDIDMDRDEAEIARLYIELSGLQNAMLDKFLPYVAMRDRPAKGLPKDKSSSRLTSPSRHA